MNRRAARRQPAGRIAEDGQIDDTATLRPAGAMTSGIGIRLLGPVEARATGGWLTAPPQQRLLLALLAVQAGHLIPMGELIDAIWAEAPPMSARASIQAMVTRLRQILAGSPAGVVERCGDGYRLLIAPRSIDVQQFRSLAQAGRDAPNAAEAVAAFDQGLALWRGPALADVPSTARIEAIRFGLAEERLSAIEDRISALLVIGRDRQAAEELTSLVADHPLAERPAGLLMVALYRCGRQADAMRVFRDLRRRLSDELAVEPGRELQHLHQQVLAGDLAPSAAASWLVGPVDRLPREQRFSASRGDPLVVPRQLPTAVAHFTGREAELRALDAVLERVGSTDGTVAISAIIGTAGVGKTALAVHWAHRVAQRFPDGQLYVNLRAFGPSRGRVRAGEAIRSFLEALGIPPDRRPTGLDAQAALYRSVLAAKRMLVVIDNAADEEQVRPLLPGSAGCLVLITSRRRLAGLGAREGADLLTLDVLTPREALELLSGRLGAEVTAAGPEAAAQLATLCARLPLALSAAAVRAGESPHVNLATLTAQLQDLPGRLEVLDVGERASNVRSVLSWSYETLSDQAAWMFRLLGVHPGPDVSLAAAASLIGRPAAQTRQILSELVSAHVLMEHMPGRWVFHDLLRAYASDQARRDDRAEREAATRRVLDYYLHTAWSAAVALRPTGDPEFALVAPSAGAEPDSISSAARAMAWYQSEHQVLLAASSWAAAAGLDAYAWRLPWALTNYLSLTGRWADQTVSMQTALAAAHRLGEKAGQARAHHGLSCALFSTDPGTAALEHLDRALILYRDLGDHVGQANARFQRGMALQCQGRSQAAIGEAQQALLLARDSGHPEHEAVALNRVGWLHAQLGNYEVALKRCQQALDLPRTVRDPLVEAATWDSIGYIHHQLGNYAQAREPYQRALELSDEPGCLSARATILDHLGDNCEAAARPAAAREYWQRAVAILEDLPAADASGIRRKLQGGLST